ncbi:MAG: serine--tRNA ligase [Patescibacteria group bacterium]|nr:serine--tRNA ligase [Patescibacteria group bacterium]
MIDQNLIRIEPEKVKEGLSAKRINPVLVDDFLTVDKKWRETVKKIDDGRAAQKQLSAERKIEESKKLKEEIRRLEGELVDLEKERDAVLNRFPNLPFPDVPRGKSEEENIVLREEGQKPKFEFSPKDYLEIGEKLGLIDVKKAAEVSGSRFGYLERDAVLLEFGLVSLALETLTAEGFIPVIPPVMIKPEVYRGMGRLSTDQEEERYFLPKDDLYLVGSSEHTIGPLHRNDVFEEKDLPRRYVGFSTCFRREAGSYGKDTKGILRVHQFDKVEMFAYSKPEDSEREHKFLLSMQEKLVKKLELPYRVMEICTGDMGFTDARQFDVETWLPGQGKYRETNSCSNTTDFQARGTNVRYRPVSKDGKSKPEFVYMLNATAFAIGRVLIAIIENYQQKDGSVAVPKALQKYLNKEIIK